jgi:hypothetical protein
VNTFADNFAHKLRTYLDFLPGATSLSFHAQEQWALFLVTASSDDAVIALGKKQRSSDIDATPPSAPSLLLIPASVTH